MRPHTAPLTRLTRFAALWLSLSVLYVPVYGAQAATNPFQMPQIMNSADMSAFTKWTSVMPRYNQQHKTAEAECRNDLCMSRQWESLLTYLKDKPLKMQMDALNDFFNAMPYIADEDNFSTDDYWQTPYELMTQGGDCEDYAIAKFISLKRLGVSESNMRIMIVRDQNLGGIIHAVLEVKMDGERYILDNQSKMVKSTASIFHYLPVYAINTHRWWGYQAS